MGISKRFPRDPRGDIFLNDVDAAEELRLENEAIAVLSRTGTKEEVAEKLGMTIYTLKNHMKRARDLGIIHRISQQLEAEIPVFAKYHAQDVVRYLLKLIFDDTVQVKDKKDLMVLYFRLCGILDQNIHVSQENKNLIVSHNGTPSVASISKYSDDQVYKILRTLNEVQEMNEGYDDDESQQPKDIFKEIEKVKENLGGKQSEINATTG